MPLGQSAEDRWACGHPEEEPVHPAPDGLLDPQEADQERGALNQEVAVCQGLQGADWQVGDASEELPS